MVKENRVQSLIIEYFKDTDDKTLVTFIESFVYHLPASNENLSKMIDKFLEDNGLKIAYCNYITDLKNPDRYLNLSSRSETNMIEDIKFAMLNLSFNRLRFSISTIELKLPNNNKKNFKFLKNELSKIITSLNNYENYFYSKEEDSELLTKIKSMKYE